MQTNQVNGEVLSVAQLNNKLTNHIEGEFSKVAVEGEISNLVIPYSGHMYFSIKDDKAQIRCVMFKFNKQKLSIKPENGMKVVLVAKVSMYAPRGDLQLIAEHMLPSGIGDLQLRFNQLKEKLNQEGLFADEYKQEIPSNPKAIGVVTSATGAAIADIISIVNKRWPNTSIYLYPSLVQGSLAAKSLCKQIKLANKHKKVEALIVGRGGGSLEDLWCFNDEELARTIFKSKLPVISAVGHEIDFTIADFVADLRAPTPSGAATLLTQDKSDVLRQIEFYLHKIIQKAERICNQKLQQLDLTASKLIHPKEKILINQARLSQVFAKLTNNLNYILINKHNKLESLAAKLHDLSPLATLARGYSIVKDVNNEKIIKSVTQVTNGQAITANLTDGSLKAKVIGIKPRRQY